MIRYPGVMQKLPQKCLLSHTDPGLSYSQISDLRPGEDKIYVVETLANVQKRDAGI